jgi:hypothetical protein
MFTFVLVVAVDTLITFVVLTLGIGLIDRWGFTTITKLTDQDTAWKRLIEIQAKTTTPAHLISFSVLVFIAMIAFAGTAANAIGLLLDYLLSGWALRRFYQRRYSAYMAKKG